MNHGKLPDESVTKREKTQTRMLFSSAVCRVQMKKTVWTKYKITEEWTNRESRHSCINVTQPYYLYNTIYLDVKPGEKRNFFFSYEIKHEYLIQQIKNYVIYT